MGILYATLAATKQAGDVAGTQLDDARLLRALDQASRSVEGLLHRRFYPEISTRYFDWPDFQYALPWRVWLDSNELAAAATQVTTGGVAISLAKIFFEPVNSGPPYTYLELDRSSTAAFGGGPTPQRSIAITGTFGYNATVDAVATLAAAVSSTTSATLTVSDSSQLSAGAILVIDAERMLVQDSAMTQAGTLTLSGTGVTTTSMADNTLAVGGSGTLAVGETILIDAERMLVVDTSGSNYVVRRAYDGSALAAHTAGAAVSAPRLLTVSRGALGTTAATHLNAATVNKHHVPSLIRELSVAVSLNHVLQETSGYSRMVGEGDNLRPASGSALALLWDDARAQYGRKMRKRVI